VYVRVVAGATVVTCSSCPGRISLRFFGFAGFRLLVALVGFCEEEKQQQQQQQQQQDGKDYM
jgi:tRNA(Phe) wybutosine-synthesizing methylase Tyw3